ncbi:hypothetical protein CLV51_1021104 [Chitinophaga niastensis]|uniref:Uncharacterized protein n=1 Tax=Chitinophaga niastensis TaxID=536980 RepID=A0A2P8HPU1_CHINA|nr:hypothetical protein [Chitinophaga niastensis]PSL48239.1 hypothetical protein CLV51_1021104 [Chitinophaga niastensis]
MEVCINPNEEEHGTPEPAVTEESIIHDGSGGAFEGTELVTEEREETPRKKEPTPY